MLGAVIRLLVFLFKYVATSGWSIARAVAWWSARAARVGGGVAATNAAGEEFFGDQWAVFQGHIRNLMATFANYEGDHKFEFIGDDFYDGTTFAAGVTRNIANKSGIPLRDVLNKEFLREDLESYALQQIEARTTYKLRSLRNIDMLKEDFLSIAGGVVTERTGIPLTNIANPEQIKADVLAWAQDQVMAQIGDDVHTAVNAEWQQGVTLLQMVRDRTGKNVSPKALLRGVNDAMVQRYMVRVKQVQEMSAADRKKFKNREAQRRFRELHRAGGALGDSGGKSVYVRVGYRAQVAKPDITSGLGLGSGFGL